MALQDAEITRHAWLRFRSRWQGNPPKDYTDEIHKLIAVAVEEDLGHGAAVRLITNGFTPARYFRAGDWRFVTDEDVTRILTIERAYLKSWGKKKRTAKRRKQRQKQIV